MSSQSVWKQTGSDTVLPGHAHGGTNGRTVEEEEEEQTFTGVEICSHVQMMTGEGSGSGSLT